MVPCLLAPFLGSGTLVGFGGTVLVLSSTGSLLFLVEHVQVIRLSSAEAWPPLSPHTGAALGLGTSLRGGCGPCVRGDPGRRQPCPLPLSRGWPEVTFEHHVFILQESQVFERQGQLCRHAHSLRCLQRWGGGEHLPPGLPGAGLGRGGQIPGSRSLCAVPSDQHHWG